MLADTIELKQITADRLFDAAEFVVEQNFEHHLHATYPTDYVDLVRSVYEEEMVYYPYSSYFTAEGRYKSIVGSIRTLKWNKNNLLPIERIFGLDVYIHCDIPVDSAVWHIGRFAVRKGYSAIELFKRLMLSAINPILETPTSVVFAECDSKLLKTLLRMGIEVQAIGKPMVYLGSETIPVQMSAATLINYYMNHSRNVAEYNLKSVYPMSEEKMALHISEEVLSTIF